MARFFNLWRNAEGGGLSEYASVRLLIDNLPDDWGHWARFLLESMTEEDLYTNRYTDFPLFASTLLTHWFENPDQPMPPIPMDIPIEEPVAYMPLPPLDIPMPPASPPPVVSPPPPASPPPNPPSHGSLDLTLVMEPSPLANLPPVLLLEPTPSHEAGSSSVSAPSPPLPVAPPNSPTGHPRTARIRTMPPPGSPFLFTISSEYEGEPSSPRGPLDSGLGTITGSSSDNSEPIDSDHECSLCGGVTDYELF